MNFWLNMTLICFILPSFLFILTVHIRIMPDIRSRGRNFWVAGVAYPAFPSDHSRCICTRVVFEGAEGNIRPAGGVEGARKEGVRFQTDCVGSKVSRSGTCHSCCRQTRRCHPHCWRSSRP